MNAGKQAATLLATCGLLWGCATPPDKLTPVTSQQDEVPPPAVVLPPEPTAYELGQIERAQALTRQGKLAEASLIWEVLVTIRPGVADYRNRWTDLQRQIDSAAADRLQKAEQAASRGQLDAAAQHYLSALALQPGNTRAADALRGVERERNKRNFLGKLSRNTLTRRAMSEAEVGAAAGDIDPAPVSMRPSDIASKAIPGASRERNDLEHASLLSSQGEVDEAIALLEKRLATNRRDDPARLMLADLYFQKAEALVTRNRPASIALLERSVRANPTHPKATQRLRELRPVAASTAATAPAAATAAAAAPAPTPALVTTPIPAAAANPVQKR